MLKYRCFIIVLLWVIIGSAQESPKQILTLHNFISIVKANHPIAKQANLQLEKAKAELQSAHGAFDPVFQFDIDRKTFNGTNYFNYYNPEIKVPTPLPIDLKTGIEDNGGKYLSSEISSGKSSYVGVELNLGKGFLTDKRRTTLKQAKLLQFQTEQERKKIINDLLFDAYVAYCQWMVNYSQVNIYKHYINVASNKLMLSKISYENGDKPWADTVEAFAQIQSYNIQLSDAEIKLNNSSFELTNYLWFNKDSVAPVLDNNIPDTLAYNSIIDQKSLQLFTENIADKHPSILSFQYKISALEAEKKLKFQSLLPTINVKANWLSKDYNAFKQMEPMYFENNYKYGIDIKLPLLLRESRGEYKKAKIKLQETYWEMELKSRQLESKYKNYYNEALQYAKQITALQQVVGNYSILLENELLKYNNGESNMFMTNTRETKLIEAQLKLLDIKLKYLKSLYAIEWSKGTLE